MINKKYISRAIVAPLIYKSRVLELYSKMLSKRNLILMYHGIVEKRIGLNYRHIEYQQIREQFIYLKKHFNILSLDDICSNNRAHASNKKHSIAITFDDGFENNYIYLLPLVEELQIPVTVFVAASCFEAEDDLLWSDALEMVMFLVKPVDIKVGEDMFVKNMNGDFVHSKTGKYIVNHIKELSNTERDAWMLEFSEKFEVDTIKAKLDPSFWRLMNCSQIREMSNHPLISIQSHGVNHYNLEFVSSEKLTQELKQSKELLEECTQAPVNIIAFPDGSYNDIVKKRAREEGYEYLIATTYRSASDAMDNFIFPRHAVSASTTFEANILRIYSAVKRFGF